MWLIHKGLKVRLSKLNSLATALQIVSLCLSGSFIVRRFSVWPRPSLSFPLHLLCCLILPKDQPPSQCLPRWLLSSGECCPRWHELMITAEASQTRHIHYITQTGLLQIPRFLTHSTVLHLPQLTLFTLFSHPPCLCCCSQHMEQWVCSHMASVTTVYS